MTLYHYSAFGFNITSEIECPELLTIKNSGQNIDIRIQIGRTPEKLNNAKTVAKRSQATKNEFLLNVENIARYYVFNGEKIIVTPVASVLSPSLRLYLLGPIFGALLHQRKIMPLHGASICFNGKAVLFCGKSKAGKSTTAHSFLERGYHLHADDVCVIRNVNGNAIVYAGYPQMKMWENTLEAKKIDKTELPQIITNLNKYSLLVQEQFHHKPLQLKKIYILEPSENNTILFQAVKGLVKFNAILENVYRPRFLNRLDSLDGIFQELATFLGPIPVIRVLRPAHQNTMQILTDMIESDLLT